MVAFIAIVTGLALLVATAYGLHRFQSMEVEFNVDRSIPLPPLDSGFPLKLGKEPQIPLQDKGSASDPVPGHVAPSKRSKPSTGWQQDLLVAKESGDLEVALSICEQQFPLWSAYNQACIILRTQLAECADPSRTANLLQRLYQLAALAEMLHDKTVPSPRLSVNQLKELDSESLDSLNFDYQRLGYAHLRLLRKHDIKLMVSDWGKPTQHIPPREAHLQQWLDLAAEHV